ncbi:MAG TPA: hypothetical protein VJH34_03470 [archaeon]|nr:hypothetical protein [archaeon]
MVNVIQLGFGQQGKRNIEKLVSLVEEGYRIELVAVSDINANQFDNPVYKTKDGKPVNLKDAFPNARQYVGRSAGCVREHPNVDVVFDSTSTVWEGIDTHAENMAAYLETKSASGRKVYATEDMPTYAVEKPFTMSLALTTDLIKNFKQNGIYVLENAVESFTPTKIASVRDIERNQFDILNVEYARMSATQEKSAKTNRLMIQNFGGCWYDKMVHDVVKFLQTYYARYGRYPDASINNADFDILDIITPSGKHSYVTRNGYFTNEFKHQNSLNESYSEANITMGSTQGWFASSHLGIKENHLDRIEGWFTPEIKRAVAEVASKNGRSRKPEDVRASYGVNHLNIESRVERITCKDKRGNLVRYLTETYPNTSFFTVKTIDNQIDVLQEGWVDGHKEFIRNALDISMNKEGVKPVIPADLITVEAEILQRVDRVANRDRRDVIDLGDVKNGEFAKFLQEPLSKAKCW